MIPDFKQLEYEERLSRMNLMSLDTRRRRGDLIQFFKIVNGLEAVKLTNDIRYNSAKNNYNLRGHSKMVSRELIKNCPSRFNYITNRVVNDWNSLPKNVVEAVSLNSFRAKLDEWLKTHELV